jgi:hypothetical protein
LGGFVETRSSAIPNPQSPIRNSSKQAICAGSSRFNDFNGSSGQAASDIYVGTPPGV